MDSHISFDERLHGIVDPWSSGDDESAEDTRPVYADSARAPHQPSTQDPAVCLENDLMTRTEAALRVAKRLLTSHLANGTVRVCLRSKEALVYDRPRFPVKRFLRERDFIATSHARETDWRGAYLMKNVPHAMFLHSEKKEPDVSAPIAGGARFVAHVNRGPLTPTKGPCESRLLDATIGRAMRFKYYEPNDVVAVVVPRSSRFREWADTSRDSPIVGRAGLLILTVDRVGNVQGLPEQLLGQ